nr:MAG TPA: hypothetical protein [Caudoviricetes sp.]
MENSTFHWPLKIKFKPFLFFSNIVLYLVFCHKIYFYHFRHNLTTFFVIL